MATHELRDRLMGLVCLVSEQPPRFGSDNGRALAWSGPSSDIPLDRATGPTALFVARGPLGLRLIYVEPAKKDFLELSGLGAEPIVSMPEERLRPGRKALEEIMEALK